MAAFADNEPAIFGSVGQEVDESLKAPKARQERVLVLVRPRNVLGDIGAAEFASSAQVISFDEGIASDEAKILESG